jgi:CO/xanthine dehydrogenase FAD-binding subunit
VDVPRGPQRFRKVGPRAAQAISKVVLASVGHRVAFGSVAATVVRARAVEAYLAGGGRDLAEAQQRLQADIRPIDDVRSTADYRRRVAANLLSLVPGLA